MKRSSQAIIISILFLYGFCSAAIADSLQHQKLIVASPRALNDAVSALERTIHCAITFEDAPYENDSRLEQLWAGGPRIPQERKLVFEFDQQGDPLKIIESLLAAYYQVDSNAVFTVLKSGDQPPRFHILPIKVMAKDGRMLPYESRFLSAQTFRLRKGETLDESVERLCKQLSSTDESIIIDRPWTFSCETNITLSATNGLSCMEQILQYYSQLPGGLALSWSLRRGPEEDHVADLDLRRLPSEQSAEQDGPKDVHVVLEVDRPLFSALRILDEMIDYNIVYEDIEYQCPCDTLRDKKGQPQVLRGGTLDFSFSLGTDSCEVVSNCVTAYNQQDNAGEYSAECGKADRTIHILPTRSKDKDGNWQKVNPLLATPVSFLSTGKDAVGILQDFFSTVTATTGKKMVVGELPEMRDAVLSFVAKGAGDQTLLEVLLQIFPKDSCYILYEPQQQSFQLNVYRRPAKSGVKGSTP